MAKEIDTTKVKEVFDTMEYDDLIDNTKLAKEWFSKNPSIYDHLTKNDADPAKQEDIRDINSNDILGTVYTPQNKSILKISEQIVRNNNWAAASPVERAKLINKFASQVEKNKELLSQIEVSTRGILSNDTKELAVPLIVKYLQYYSNLAADYEKSSPDFVTVAVLSESTFLGALGFILGPALAAGYNILLQTEPRLSFAVFLLIQLSADAGIPEGTIRIIPGKIDLQVLFTDKNIKVVSLYGNVEKTKSNSCKQCTKKLLMFSALKIPMIVFSNADINSACNYLVKSVWKYQGNLPWSINKVVVQEDIYESFLTKLRQCHIKVGPSNNKLSDITPPFDKQILDDLNRLTEEAKKQGIELLQLEKEYKNFTPTILIGGIPSGETDVPVPTVTAFRTINEAVALANNTKQGFGASIWTENIALANEVTRKLDVANVWINCNGLIDPSIAISLRKESGKGYFAGREAISEYYTISESKRCEGKTGDSTTVAEDKIISTVSAAVMAHKAWSKLSFQARAQKLKDVVEYLATNASEDNVEFFENWIYDAMSELDDSISSCIYDDYDVKSYREPIGLFVITPKSEETANMVIAAILLGSSVIVLSDGGLYSTRCAELIKHFSGAGLQSGLLSVLNYSANAVNLLFLHKEVKGYYAEDCFNIAAVVNVKNVWSTVGQSFI